MLSTRSTITILLCRSLRRRHCHRQDNQGELTRQSLPLFKTSLRHKAMSVPSGSDGLIQLLEKANLMCYKDNLLEQGADDLQQLKELDDDEFEQLCSMVGMDKKPFHVMRLKKSLNRHTSKPHPPTTQTTPTVASPNTPLSNQNSTTSLSQASLSNTASMSSQNQKSAPSKAFLEAMEVSGQPLSIANMVRASSSPTLNSSLKLEGHGKTLFLPPYLQEGSDSKDFDELIDSQTPVQKTLGPCPFLPSVWDPERRELIRKYAGIYGQDFNKRQKELLTPFEEQVNEGAFQLCLRDPTLLVRREELFVLAKRAVKEGGYTYYHGYSKSKDIDNTIATTGQKRARPNDSTHLQIAPPKLIITSGLPDDMPKKLSGRMRQEKMNELERLISSNKAQQAAKLIELEQAQQLCNFSSAFSIQLEVESLGNACQQLQTSYAALKRKQRRSDRYYNLKAREEKAVNGGQLDGNQKTLTSDLSPSTLVINDEELGQGDSSYLRKDLSSGGDDTSKATNRPTVTATVIPRSQGGCSSMPVVTSTPESSPEGNNHEVQDLVKNVSHATDEVNSLMIREFQKQLVWDM